MKYFLRLVDEKWQEISREKYIKAERGAGFQPKDDDKNKITTASFGNGFIQGYVSYNDKHPDEDFEKVAPIASQFPLEQFDQEELIKLKAAMEKAMEPMHCITCNKFPAENRTFLLAPQSVVYGGETNKARIIFIGICVECSKDWNAEKEKQIEQEVINGHIRP